MDDETNKIKQHIDLEREQLGRNLDEIEQRVKKATDLKTYFNKNTGWILGAAVAGGFLLSRALPATTLSEGGGPRWDRNLERNTTSAGIQPRSSHLARVSETLDDIFEGLVGVVSDKVHSFVADAVPGFREQYDAIERQRGRSGIR